MSSDRDPGYPSPPPAEARSAVSRRGFLAVAGAAAAAGPLRAVVPIRRSGTRHVLSPNSAGSTLPGYPWLTAAQLPGPLESPAVFANPPAETRPGVYWWWYSGKNETIDPAYLRAQLQAMTEAGIGKPHIEYWGVDYADAQQRSNLMNAAATYKADRLQLEQTLGLGFPWTTPDTLSSRKLSQQTLNYGRVNVAGPTAFSGTVPAAIGGGGGDLVAVTAAKVLVAGPPVTQLGTPPASSTVLDPASLTDLTSQVTGQLLNWSVPAGDWIIFAFWAQNPNGAGFLAGPGERVSITDADSTQAGLAYVAANQLGGAAGSLTGVGEAFYEESLESGVSGLYWNNTANNNTLDEFRRLRGYDMTKYLPLLFVQGKNQLYIASREATPDFDLPGGGGARYRHDIDETTTDTYIHNHLLVIQRWAETFGQRFDSQAAYGTSLDVIRANRALAAAGALADTESWSGGDWAPYQTQSNPNWRFALDFYRQASSGAAQGGGLEISLETGDSVNYDTMEQLADLKYTMDKAWSAGVTRPEIHGISLQWPDDTWPGGSRWDIPLPFSISESWNPATYPEWANMRPLAGYWGRGALVLEQGAARTDVAYLRDSFITIVPPTLGAGTVAPPINDTRTLEEAGFTVGYVDPVGITEQPPGPRGELFPDGPAYRAVVIDPAHQNYVDPAGMPGAAARALNVASAKGLAIIFVGTPPARGTSGRNPAAEDAQVRAAVSAILKRPATRVVAANSEVADALTSIGLRPRAQWPADLAPQMNNTVSGGVYSQLRERDGTSYFYLWNSSEQAVRYTGSFEATGTPYRLDLWSGTIQPVMLFRTSAGRTEIPIELGPMETGVVAINTGQPPGVHPVATTADRVLAAGHQGVELQAAHGGPQTVTFSTRQVAKAELPAVPEEPIVLGPAGSQPAWQLTVQSWGPEGKTDLPVIPLTGGLQAWHEVSGLAGISGIGTYSISFTLTESWTATGRGTFLDLGDIAGGSIQAYVNGQLATPNIAPKSGARTDITGLLRPGANKIAVTFASTLFNRVRATPSALQSRPSIKWVIAAHPGPQTYGLLGPVTLIPYARATVPLPGQV